MAVVLPPQSGSVYSEYAATNTTFTRLLMNINSILTPVFECRVNYERKDYLVDANGNRIATVVPPDGGPGMIPGAGTDARYGSVYVPYDQMVPIFSEPCNTAISIGEQIADMIDALIQKDLVARGIIPA